MFPSPSGVLCFSISIWKRGNLHKSFRPLPGFSVSQYFRLISLIRLLLPFPSPSGVLCFSISRYVDIATCEVAFPSPSRVLCFSIREINNLFGNKRHSFRPLPGFCVSQSVKQVAFQLPSWFPSPSGVLCFSIMKKNFEKMVSTCFRPLPGFCVSQLACQERRKLWEEMFPSPSGVLCFSIFDREEALQDIDVVSVPFRGSVFLNRLQSGVIPIWIPVSVPFRGSVFLNKNSMQHVKTVLCWFPSPSGVLCFSIKNKRYSDSKI